MDEWTLATPFIDKEKEIDLYLNSINNIDLPREHINLFWLDQSNNPNIYKKLNNYIKENGHLYKSCSLEKKDFEVFFCNRGDPVSRRVAIANVMTYLSKNSKGNLLIWEDDIYAPKDAFYSCNKLLSSLDEIAAVTACQYQRRPGCENSLMAWNWVDVPVFGENDTSGERKLSAVPLDYELSKGFSSIGASATGFILIKERLLDGYTFDGVTDGPDVMLGKYITQTLDKYLMLDWGCKSVHLGRDQDDNIKLFKSDLCHTEVIGYDS